MDVFKLEKPELTKFDGLRIYEKIGKPENWIRQFQEANTPNYRYWDRVKYLSPPEGCSAEEFWFFIKLMRKASYTRKKSLVKHKDGQFFTWDKPSGMDQFCHEVDLKLGGSLVASQSSIDREKRKYIHKGIMEEAIASSQLEGASTTRKVAKRMLQEKREPRDRAQQMILNNYKTIIALEEEYREARLDIKLLLDLHAGLTEKTIDENDIGRFRIDRDDIYVTDDSTGIIYHIPPKEEFLRPEIARLLDYANDDLIDEQFIHPVIKAIIIHFWIGYLHPFTDGNGRMARALFYWYLLRHGYWAFAYLPLSRIIKDSPAQYRDAYVYSEQDDYDLTYFIDYNIRKIMQANRDFEKYIEKKQAEQRVFTSVAKGGYNLNDRQLQLLRYLHKNANESTTFKSHATIYGVTRLTAIKDLRRLEELGFITSKKIGRQVHFFASDKISELF